jgi:hypothetical protein
VLLELMPVGALAEHFDPVMGRPGKELYAMAGLIFLKECFHWTKNEALNSEKDTYKNLVRIFYEQCEVQEETVQVKAKIGGNVMQN